ncbi:hypothetical protein CYMTET_26761 [Cymbomonas tetramitiformis]|uniref:Uncharacterized protein n=1 Tax=Cymbomonas tetramitiformis TaxID=36881 RepID=A0AAE0KXK5_9CHLO|nr:hypothetical protein CYMTET_26761 [Cymbomonas tetramitiformis]|eukprot:gene13300-15716_t
MAASITFAPSLVLSSKKNMAGRSLRSATKAPVAARPTKLAVSADYIGSATNLVMVANIGATLAMGRFKFSPIGMWVPSTKKEEYAAAIEDGKDSGSWFADPSGFSAAEILAFGSLGHAHGIGMVLGLKAMGML